MTLLWKQAVRVPTFIFACSFLPPRLCWSFSIFSSAPLTASWLQARNAAHQVFWALPDPNSTVSWQASDPSRGRPSPSICGGKAYGSCICYLSKRHFVRDFLQKLYVEFDCLLQSWFFRYCSLLVLCSHRCLLSFIVLGIDCALHSTPVTWESSF